MNTPEPYSALPAVTVEPLRRQTPAVDMKLSDGLTCRIRSHNASNNAHRLCPSMRGLLSIKWALYGRHHAADGYYSASAEDAATLRAAHGRWTASITWPKRVPADLGPRYGGIFG